jgi:two-component system, chemotaxis family, sensor kinase CheA
LSILSPGLDAIGKPKSGPGDTRPGFAESCPLEIEHRLWSKTMDDLIKEFLVESYENLDRLDSELVKLESDPSSQELLSSIFRTIHTIKGSCGFLGFSKLEKVAHAGESLLSRLRDGKISLAQDLTTGLLAMVDAIRKMLDAIQATEQDGNETYPELIETLKRLQQPQQESPVKTPIPLPALAPPKKEPSKPETPTPRRKRRRKALLPLRRTCLPR